MAKVTIITFLLGVLTFNPLCAFTQEVSELQIITRKQLISERAIVGEDSGYTLGKDDIVEISVRAQPEFTGNFIVGPDGKIQYKFVGDIQAEGLTKAELCSVITEKLESYVKIPEVTVSILAYRSKFVYILGEVRSPGKYPMKGDAVTLRDALVQAGLPTADAALRRVYVINPEMNKPVYTKVDIYKLLYKGILKDNLKLLPGDLVVVPSTIPSEINKALGRLLSPITRTAAVEAAMTTFGN